MSSSVYDVIVIGSGATGSGVARDCAMRGLRTCVIERGEPGMGTTVTSTHLIHGGLRYLLYDRLTTHTTCWDSGHIVRIARPLLHRLPILWPVYRGQSHGIETVETLLESYDGFQRMKLGKPHLRLTAEETLALFPKLKKEGLKGALSFDEWWVDPLALVKANLDSARSHGAEVMTGAPVTALLRSIGRIEGVSLGDRPVRASVVINAAGPWVDKVASLAGTSIALRLQKGTHLIYKERMVPYGLLLEAVDHGRYVFVVPSPQGTLVGPTDLPAGADPDKVASAPDEIRYLLASVKRYLPDFPEKYDATIVGSRPILGQAGDERLLSREYEVFDHETRDNLAGFLTIGGGKMSDFRVMAQAAADLACVKLKHPVVCRTHFETLAGETIESFPSFPRPWRPLKKFLRGHPQLREMHSLAYLAAAFGRHLLRKPFAAHPAADPEAYRRYYAG
jgi:glycerol-3-phosphate dehydrogenase